MSEMITQNTYISETR